jgi:hypothetical protein
MIRSSNLGSLNYLFLLQNTRIGTEMPTQPPVKWVPANLSSERKKKERNPDLFSPDVQNDWNNNSTSFTI